MRVLFTSTPGPGHFHPLVPIARALADAGHEVAFACSPAFQPTVEAAGFRCFPAGLHADHREVYPQLRNWRGPGLMDFMYRDVFAGLRSRAMVPDLLALAVA